MASKNTHKKNYETKVRLMELSYKAYRQVWNGAEDDRLVFCNTYDQTMDALEVMKKIDNSLIWCGFQKMFDENCELMNNIIANFKASH